MKYITDEKIEGMAIERGDVQRRNCTKKAGREVKFVVMHYTGNVKDKAESNAKYFYNNNLSASAHFFVDEESVFQSVELKDIAWHCGTKGKYYNSCRNSNSVGIEMCCKENYTVSEKTQENAARLCALVCRAIDIKADEVDAFVIRHFDVTHKMCPKQWIQNEGEFVKFKERVKEILNERNDIENHWARESIEKLLEKGIMTGYEDGSFKPDNFMTRAEVATVVAKALNYTSKVI